MVFSSLPFLFGYLPVVLAVLKLAPLHARNFCLFLVSLIFYGWSEPVYIVNNNFDDSSRKTERVYFLISPSYRGGGKLFSI